MTEPELLDILKDVDGRLCPGQEWWLFNQAMRLPWFGRILEIGTFHGRSTCALALACKDTQRKVFTIDNDAEAMQRAEWNFAALNIRDRIDPWIMDSSALDDPPYGWPFFDFAFIDGDHTFESLRRDFYFVRTMMKPKVGARIAFHDVIDSWPDVKRFWDDVASKVLKNHEFCHSIASGTLNR
jgi:predicted O-methyltransferase YrrM